ncbi:MAG: hypothetical protein ACK5KR_00760 [Breznakia sp.]
MKNLIDELMEQNCLSVYDEIDKEEFKTIDAKEEELYVDKKEKGVWKK